ncbi:MAG: TlpA disulfide reductase family protein [Phycisphaerae bacterium]|jgi:thiol-disulfide isomerase/thioredoxin
MPNAGTPKKTLSWKLGLAIVSLMLAVPAASARTTNTDQPSEQDMIRDVTRLGAFDPDRVPEEERLGTRQAVNQQLVLTVDALLERFPETRFREQALILQLGSLADLARVHTGYLSRLLAQTEQIAKRNPTGRLASENAYYAIQAFVLGARAENMPRERRLRGTQERYQAFLADFPTSERVPVIRASLIRNLIAQDLTSRAREEFAKLETTHPNHKATRRARGELYRATAVGQPFAFGFTTPTGKSVSTTDYLGSVLLIHFWATWSQPSMEAIPELIDLHGEFEGNGLSLIGVNVDRNGEQVDAALENLKMPWPQYYDYKGFENDVLVLKGVLKIPTYFIVDRRGVLRSIDPGAELRPTIKRLLLEPAPGTEKKGAENEKHDP